MKLVCFGASSSTNSVNKKVAVCAANMVEGAEVDVLDLNDYALPMFSEDKEKEIGHPKAINNFLSKIGSADAVVASFAEHNGSYSVAYKNLFDWCTRVVKDLNVFQNKPMVVFAASPGPRGAGMVLKHVTDVLPFFKGNIKASMSIPNVYDSFDQKTSKFTNSELESKVKETVQCLSS